MIWPFSKKAEPIPQTSNHERARLAKDRFLKLARRDPQEAVLFIGSLPMDIGHKAMMRVVAELAHRAKAEDEWRSK